MSPLLLELQTEELPPKALALLAEAFATQVHGALVRQRLAPDDRQALTVFATPRRLGMLIADVAVQAPDESFRQKLLPAAIGLDAAGKATPALQKRLAALGGPSGGTIQVDQLRRESDGKQDILVYEGRRPGAALAAGLQMAIDEALAALPIPKLMSYQLADGTTTVAFARPAHRLVALHGDAVVPVRALGLTSGRETVGHRFMSQGPLSIRSAAGYADLLAGPGRVVASFARRRQTIVEQLERAAHARGATAIMPPALLDEVTALVEWPVVYESGFDAEFLAVPHECLILTMQQNQRYFALQDATGPDARLLNRFLLVANLEARDGGAAVVAGNARVVRARLADAKFFYDQDMKRSLESRIPLLAAVVHHNRLGSQLERVERLTQIAVAIGRELGADITHVERAARLAKADLRTEMVGEFPTLQGVMGTYYARHDGEASDVADAIEQHYRPRFAGDALPGSVVATSVALADKLEMLVGLFGVGVKPTGDKDPFALRRHALGVLRMLIEGRLPLALDRLLAITEQSFAAAPHWRPARDDLLAFLHDRLRGILRDAGASSQEIESVVAQGPLRIDEVPARLEAVRAFMQTPESASLSAANKRIGNILKKAGTVPEKYDSALLFEPAERRLALEFERTGPVSEAHRAHGDYAAALLALVPLKLPVDQFFDEVMVMVDDAAIRGNRLALLAALRARMNRVADLSLLAAG